MAQKKKGEQLPPGYLAVSRKFFEHDLWKERRVFSWAEAWLDLMQTAWYGEKPSRQLINRVMITYQRGEMAASVRFLQQRWLWKSTRTVHHFLTVLEQAGQITRRTESGQTIITLPNYDLYNGQRSNPRGNAIPSQDEKNGTPNGTPSETPKGDDNQLGVSVSETPSETPSGTIAEHARNKEEERLEERKEEYTDGKGADAPPPPPPPDPKEESFKRFMVWVDEHAPRVNKMQKPFSLDQYTELGVKKFRKDFIESLLLEMENYAPLLKKNISAYLTFLKWAKIRNDNPLYLGGGKTPPSPKTSTADEIRAARQKQTA